MAETCANLFVYGTLRRASGHAMAHSLAARGRFVGAGSTCGRLYDLGAYPGMVEERGSEDRVRGEVYELHDSDAALAALDAYEGCGPDDPRPWLFERVLTSITLDGGEPVRAWVYCYRGPLTEARPIPSGDYLAPFPDAP
jgi:gamma-glutamylcyclotransferase (GGCT)/AIG2-like uncharacterized protein YtfP